MISAKGTQGYRGIPLGYGIADLRGEGGSGWVGGNGGAEGMNAHLRIYPKSGYVIAVLSNFDPPAADRVAEFIGRRLIH
jgi:CubicO group peptidase (beta-lactamase class C family)